MSVSQEELDADNALKKMASNFGVRSYVIMNDTGIPLKFQGVENASALHISALSSELLKKSAKFVKSHGDHDELVVLRLRTKKGEYIMTPDEGFSMVVMQDPNYVEPVVPVKPGGAPGDENKAPQ